MAGPGRPGCGGMLVYVGVLRECAAEGTEGWDDLLNWARDARIIQGRAGILTRAEMGMCLHKAQWMPTTKAGTSTDLRLTYLAHVPGLIMKQVGAVNHPDGGDERCQGQESSKTVKQIIVQNVVLVIGPHPSTLATMVNWRDMAGPFGKLTRMSRLRMASVPALADKQARR